MRSVQHTICHCEERSDVAISRKGHLIAYGVMLPAASDVFACRQKRCACGTMSLTAVICLRRDIVFDSDIALQ